MVVSKIILIFVLLMFNNINTNKMKTIIILIDLLILFASVLAFILTIQLNNGSLFIASFVLFLLFMVDKNPKSKKITKII